jgi:pimeloyl-ACP methyl ester carboxylesterase
VSTSGSSATVVLVHGAFHDAACFDGLVDALRARGVACVAPDRPGHGASPLPRGDLHGDAAAVGAVLDGIAGPKVLVGHSYGGAVISEAGAGRDDVVHLVFLAALVLDAGESAQGQEGAPPFEPTPLSAAVLLDDANDAYVLDVAAARDAFYHDVERDEADRLTASLQPQAIATLSQTANAGAWRDIPSTYVIARLDRAVPVNLQRFFAGRTTKTVEMDTGHFPFLAEVDAVADLVATYASGA